MWYKGYNIKWIQKYKNNLKDMKIDLPSKYKNDEIQIKINEYNRNDIQNIMKLLLRNMEIRLYSN